MLFIKKMSQVLISFILLCGLSFTSNADNHLAMEVVNETQIKIEKVVNSYTSNNAFEGVILVAKSEKIVFEKAYGFADRVDNQKTTAAHAFGLASLSKPITATLMLKLEEQGKLKLTDTLADHFLEFKNNFGRKVTLHHLLSHTSGLPDHFAINGWFDVNFHKQTSEQAFINMIAKLSPKFAPGADYLYSNLGYFLVGKVIEKATGKSYSESLKNNILRPLNMNKSGVASGFELSSGIVKGYQWDKKGGYHEQVAKDMNLFGAGSAIYASAKDLHRFDLALYGEQLINEQSKTRLFNPKISYSWRVGKIPVSKKQNVNVHMYDGQFDGYSSMMTRFIDDKHSIIILSNVGISYFLKQQLTFDIADVLYNQPLKNRENDVSLILIKSLIAGTFEQTLTGLEAKKGEYNFNEASLSALAYQILWSGLGNESLKLFSFITNTFVDSLKAKTNLERACNHHVTNGLLNKRGICK